MSRLPTINDCGACGVCCLHMGYPPYLRGDNGGPAEAAWSDMPADLKSELLEFIDGYEGPDSDLDGPCVWFDVDSKRCRHHESRPQVCRDFRVGGKGCLQWRTAYDIA